MQGVASGKQSFREHCATKWFLEANPRNISASKISRYTVTDMWVHTGYTQEKAHTNSSHRRSQLARWPL